MDRMPLSFFSIHHDCEIWTSEQRPTPFSPYDILCQHKDQINYFANYIGNVKLSRWANVWSPASLPGTFTPVSSSPGVQCSIPLPPPTNIWSTRHVTCARLISPGVALQASSGNIQLRTTIPMWRLTWGFQGQEILSIRLWHMRCAVACTSVESHVPSR